MTPHLSLHCYLQDQATERPLPCSDVTIHADPATLRSIAHFLLASADEFDLAQECVGMHAHLQDAWPGWQDDFPDLVVVAA
ncbi:Imm32 family immunity protein [Janthinobacterium sp. LB2P70]|uniref:Imm32 family immunity protein n=1 Tax=Janthinobacterium sp. LB2P70 TaxID=3424197 RepID=UPI003F20E365